MDEQLNDGMPLAGLNLGQARQFLSGLIADRLANLISPNLQKPEPKRLLTIDEALDRMRESAIIHTKGSLYKMHHDGKITARRVGKRLIFDLVELDAWIADRVGCIPSRTTATQNLARSAGRKRNGRV